MTSPDTQSSPAKTPRSNRTLSAALAAAAAVIILGFATALVLGAGGVPILAAVVAARNAIVVGLVAVALVLSATLLVPWPRRVILHIWIPIVVFTVAGVISVAGAGLTASEPASAGADQLRILEWNTNGDLVDAREIVELVKSTGSNALVLSSVEANVVDDVARGLAEQHFKTLRPAGSEVAILTTLPYRLASSALSGPNPQSEAIAEPAESGLPSIVAVHLAQPTLRGNASWNAEVDWLSTVCSGAKDAVVVGDFNATIDNVGTRLRGCADAALQARAAAVGTWPTSLPTWLGMPIDHAFFSEADLSVVSFSVLTSEDTSGARHRPTLTVLTARP